MLLRQSDIIYNYYQSCAAPSPSVYGLNAIFNLSIFVSGKETARDVLLSIRIITSNLSFTGSDIYMLHCHNILYFLDTQISCNNYKYACLLCECCVMEWLSHFSMLHYIHWYWCIREHNHTEREITFKFYVRLLVLSFCRVTCYVYSAKMNCLLAQKEQE